MCAAGIIGVPGWLETILHICALRRSVYSYTSRRAVPPPSHLPQTTAMVRWIPRDAEPQLPDPAARRQNNPSLWCSLKPHVRALRGRLWSRGPHECAGCVVRWPICALGRILCLCGAQAAQGRRLTQSVSCVSCRCSGWAELEAGAKLGFIGSSCGGVCVRSASGLSDRPLGSGTRR